MLTIFTPTYNRKKEIVKLYDSLENQTNKDFEWLIVDDGSTDDTEEVINKFKSKNIIEIKYIKQKNSGKSIAHNKGVKNAKGELFVCIDSDDYLTNNAVEIIIKEKDKIDNNKELCGIIFLNSDDKTNKIVGTEFPENYIIADYFSIYNKLGVKGDKTIIYKTEVIKKYLFPEIDNEKFVPEALIYNRISKKYKLLCINEVIKMTTYLETGYSKNYFKLCKNNPKGQIIYYNELFKLQPTLYNVAAYNMYCIYAKKKFWDTIQNHPSRFKAFIMYIPAYIKYIQKERKKS